MFGSHKHLDRQRINISIMMISVWQRRKLQTTQWWEFGHNLFCRNIQMSHIIINLLIVCAKPFPSLSESVKFCWQSCQMIMNNTSKLLGLIGCYGHHNQGQCCHHCWWSYNAHFTTKSILHDIMMMSKNFCKNSLCWNKKKGMIDSHWGIDILTRNIINLFFDRFGKWRTGCFLGRCIRSIMNRLIQNQRKFRVNRYQSLLGMNDTVGNDLWRIYILQRKQWRSGSKNFIQNHAKLHLTENTSRFGISQNSMKRNQIFGQRVKVFLGLVNLNQSFHDRRKCCLCFTKFCFQSLINTLGKSSKRIFYNSQKRFMCLDYRRRCLRQCCGHICFEIIDIFAIQLSCFLITLYLLSTKLSKPRRNIIIGETIFPYQSDNQWS